MDFLLCRSSLKQCVPSARHLRKREALGRREKLRRIQELELPLRLQKREALGDARKERPVDDPTGACSTNEVTVEVDCRSRESYCDYDSSVDVVCELLELKEAIRRRREAENNGELIKDDDEDGNRDGTASSSSSSSSQSYETAQEEGGGDDDCEETAA